MSSTRRQSPESAEFRQEKFCSDAVFNNGLKANLVVRKCQVLESANTKELIFWLQGKSHQAGGLPSFAEFLAEKKLLSFMPTSLRSNKSTDICSEEDLKAVEAETGSRWYESALAALESIDMKNEAAAVKQKYSVRDIQASVRREIQRNAETMIQDLCLNPGFCASAFPVSFARRFEEILNEIMQGEKSERLLSIVHTDVASSVFSALEFCREAQGMVLIEGSPRIGKSVAARVWTDANSGIARICEIPPSNDDLGFFREIGKALGVSTTYSLKGVQLRERIEDVLCQHKLMLCFDEAHHAWPQRNRREALPFRINWIMSMVNRGVPVALISTPQFFEAQGQVEKKTGWRSGQFIGRVSRFVRLPEELSQHDLERIVRHYFPEVPKVTQETLVAYAKASRKYVAAIEHTFRHALYFSKRDGRSTISTKDVAAAMEEGVMPSDFALDAKLRKGTGNRPAAVVQTPCRPAARDVENDFPAPQSARVVFTQSEG